MSFKSKYLNDEMITNLVNQFSESEDDLDDNSSDEEEFSENFNPTISGSHTELPGDNTEPDDDIDDFDK